MEEQKQRRRRRRPFGCRCPSSAIMMMFYSSWRLRILFLLLISIYSCFWAFLILEKDDADGRMIMTMSMQQKKNENISSSSSSSTTDDLSNNSKIRNNNNNNNDNKKKCALCFFGLPRSYQTLVWPSLQKNVLQYNEDCDIFVHYYYQRTDHAGRFNEGGINMDPDEILILRKEKNMTTPRRTILFTNDTDDQFWQQRKNQLFRYHNTTTTVKGGEIKPVYYPWKEEDWNPKSSLDNLVRQWHSIESVFHLMEQYATTNHINYDRVAMLRNDVMFVTPFDIWRKKKKKNDENVFWVPSFASYPINDRMIYGPYEAVKIWSTKRFELLETQRVKDPNAVGYVMHSERFLEETIIPAMQQQNQPPFGYQRSIDTDLCFLRTRANSKVVLNDCSRHCVVMATGTKKLGQIIKIKDCIGKNVLRTIPKDEIGMIQLIETISGLQCTEPMDFVSSTWAKYTTCSKSLST